MKLETEGVGKQITKWKKEQIVTFGTFRFVLRFYEFFSRIVYKKFVYFENNNRVNFSLVANQDEI